MIKKNKIIILVFMLLNFAGCGYGLVGTSVSLPEHIKTVAVPIFVNKTSQYNVEGIITNAFIDEFISSGKLKTKEKKEANAVLEGEVVSYQVNPLSYDTNGAVLEYRLKISINILFKDLINDEVILKRGGLEAKSDYLSLDSLGEQEKAEEEAFKKVSQDIAREAVSMILEGF